MYINDRNALHQSSKHTLNYVVVLNVLGVHRRLQAVPVLSSQHRTGSTSLDGLVLAVVAFLSGLRGGSTTGSGSSGGLHLLAMYWGLAIAIIIMGFIMAIIGLLLAAAPPASPPLAAEGIAGGGTAVGAGWPMMVFRGTMLGYCVEWQWGYEVK